MGRRTHEARLIRLFDEGLSLLEAQSLRRAMDAIVDRRTEREGIVPAPKKRGRPRKDTRLIPEKFRASKTQITKPPEIPAQ